MFIHRISVFVRGLYGNRGLLENSPEAVATCRDCGTYRCRAGGNYFAGGRPRSAPGTSPIYSAYVDVVPLSESGAQEYDDVLNNGSNYRALTTVEISNPNSALTGRDYRELFTSEQLLTDAAQQLDVSADEVEAAIDVEQGTDEFIVTFTASGTSADAAQATAQAVTEAFRDALMDMNVNDASARLLITTSTPNPEITTNAGYTTSRMPTYAALATSPALLESVARAEGLAPRCTDRRHHGRC